MTSLSTNKSSQHLQNNNSSACMLAQGSERIATAPFTRQAMKANATTWKMNNVKGCRGKTSALEVL